MSESLFVQAVRLCHCDRCGAVPGERCHSPSGKKTSTPHLERMWELKTVPGAVNKGIVNVYHFGN